MAKIIWKSNEKIEDEWLIESLKPSQKEIENADFEIKTITLLQDLGVL